MKILIACDLYWPNINGIATFSRNLAHGLAERGHDVIVVAPSQTGKKYTETDGNYRVMRTASVPFSPINGLRVSVSPYLEMRKIVRDFRPDIIHIQTPIMVGLAAMQVGERYKIPMVATNHSMSENLLENIKFLARVAKPMSRLLKEYVRLIHRNVAYMTLPTESAIEIFGDMKKKMPMPIEAVSNGIDLTRFAPKAVPRSFYERFDIPRDKKIVLYVGRMDAEKHLATLVRAFALVNKTCDAHLLMVGQGNDGDNLRELVRDLNITSSVTFTGRVSDEDLPILDRVGTLYCMTSPAELQCIAMLEAMASGQPVVSVDAGPLKELCQDGRNGYLCELDNPGDMAKKIIKILGDNTLRDNMAAESLAIAKTHDLTYTLDRFEAIYKLVLEDPKKKPKKRRLALLRISR